MFLKNMLMFVHATITIIIICGSCSFTYVDRHYIYENDAILQCLATIMSMEAILFLSLEKYNRPGYIIWYYLAYVLLIGSVIIVLVGCFTFHIVKNIELDKNVLNLQNHKKYVDLKELLTDYSCTNVFQMKIMCPLTGRIPTYEAAQCYFNDLAYIKKIFYYAMTIFLVLTNITTSITYL